MKSKNLVVLATTIGTVLEWSEFICYGYLTPKLSTLFFSEHRQHALLFTFAIFATSYIARPLGALFFGYIGDYHGRKISLFYSIFLMGLATFIIALTPTYNTIGGYATAILIICRLIQGMAVAGEFTGAAIFIIEHYKGKYPTSAVSWVSFSSALGMSLGAGIATIVLLPGMPTWAWRIPFLIGFLGCILGGIFRLVTMESPKFKIAKDSNSLSILQFQKKLFNYSWELRERFFKSFLIAAFVGVYICICNIWWSAYVSISSTSHIGQLFAFYGNIMVVLLTPITAFLVDYFDLDYKKVMKYGLILSFLSVPGIFFITDYRNSAFMFLCAQAIYAINNVMVTATMFRYLSEIFPVEIRYFSLGVSWSTAVALFGGTAPFLAQIIIANTNSSMCIALYVATFGVISSLIL
jgi:MHS family proline/betaine transporter-like MFS transporter